MQRDLFFLSISFFFFFTISPIFWSKQSAVIVDKGFRVKVIKRARNLKSFNILPVMLMWPWCTNECKLKCIEEKKRKKGNKIWWKSNVAISLNYRRGEISTHKFPHTFFSPIFSLFLFKSLWYQDEMFVLRRLKPSN